MSEPTRRRGRYRWPLPPRAPPEMLAALPTLPDPNAPPAGAADAHPPVHPRPQRRRRFCRIDAD
ncbi:MAG: hypothetical protein OXC71_07070 [Chloroflexi bacterium]|nr:hypothetical protein [Chloroflexota bacterium]